MSFSCSTLACTASTDSWAAFLLSSLLRRCRGGTVKSAISYSIPKAETPNPQRRIVTEAVDGFCLGWGINAGAGDTYIPLPSAHPPSPVPQVPSPRVGESASHGRQRSSTRLAIMTWLVHPKLSDRYPALRTLCKITRLSRRRTNANSCCIGRHGSMSHRSYC